jgi:hypothetical protein
MKTYQIENPTTKQLFNTIIANEYITLEQLKPKAKQVHVLLKNYFNTNEILVTFANVTNCGGFPIFLSVDCCLYEIASDFYPEWYELTESEQNETVELLGYYMQKYEDLFFN